MKDPFFSSIMWEIERTIFETDKNAKEQQISLTDSNVKSSLSKAKGIAKNGALKSKPKNEKDELIFGLASQINALRSDIRESGRPDTEFESASELKLADWLLALKAVEDSVKRRMVSGGRAYLDYLIQFMAQARIN